MIEPMSESEEAAVSTAERLMDAAEELFAVHGFDGVGVRRITEAASANLGAVTYHFGSKEDLLVATFRRRFLPANRRRAVLLRAARETHGAGPLPVEAIVEALMRPPLELTWEHPHFPLLLSRILAFPPACMRETLANELPVALAPFLIALHETLPGIALPVLFRRLRMAGGTLLMFAVQFLGHGEARKPDGFESALSELVRFASAGLSAPPAADEAATDGPVSLQALLDLMGPRP